MDPVFLHVLETVFTALPIAVGFVWAIKSDTKVLKQRIDSVDIQLAKIDNLLVTLAETKGRIDRIDDRVTLQGKRVDDLTNRFNEVFDKRPSVRFGPSGTD